MEARSAAQVTRNAPPNVLCLCRRRSEGRHRALSIAVLYPSLSLLRKVTSRQTYCSRQFQRGPLLLPQSTEAQNILVVRRTTLSGRSITSSVRSTTSSVKPLSARRRAPKPQCPCPLICQFRVRDQRYGRHPPRWRPRWRRLPKLRSRPSWLQRWQQRWQEPCHRRPHRMRACLALVTCRGRARLQRMRRFLANRLALRQACRVALATRAMRDFRNHRRRAYRRARLRCSGSWLPSSLAALATLAVQAPQTPQPASRTRPLPICSWLGTSPGTTPASTRPGRDADGFLVALLCPWAVV